MQEIAVLIRNLLARLPNIAILATSQVELYLASEHVYAVDPLPTPPAGAAEIGDLGAVKLFIARARASDRRFELNARNMAGVAEICRQLDGLPLALEMAVGRLRLLGVQGLQLGLRDRLEMLRGTGNDARHASLQQMLEWSHGLLEAFDRKIFRRLAAFPAGFSLDAAIEVAGWDILPWPVADALGRLIDRSLVMLEQREPPRYRLLETLRLYALDKLREAKEEAQAAECHARYFTAVFETAERKWEEMPDPDWVARYHPELDHLRCALEWALAAPERRHTAIALTTAAFMLLRMLSLYGEALRYTERALPLADLDIPAESRSRLLGCAARLFLTAGDLRSLPFAEQSAELCRTLGDRPGHANALMTIAQIFMWQERVEEARNLLEEASGLLERTGLKKSRLRLLCIYGNFYYYARDIPNARRQNLEALALAKTIRSEVQASLLSDRALYEYVAGNVDEAIECSYAVLEHTDMRFGYKRGHTLCQLGTFHIAKGEYALARSRLEEAFAVHAHSGNYPVQYSLQAWAMLLGLEGHLSDAAQLIGFTDAELERRGETLDPSDGPNYMRLVAALQAGLPQAECEVLKAKGAQWSTAEAVAFASSRIVQKNTSAN